MVEVLAGLGMVNSFVMSNGLPIYASGSGYNTDWENEGVNETLQNKFKDSDFH